MKYSAKKLNATEWAVFAGKTYFADSVTTSQCDAEIKAVETSARWYQEQVINCRTEWSKKRAAMGIDTSSDDYRFADIVA